MFLKKKRCWGSKTKTHHSKNAYNYCRVWRILMITMVEERWRTFSFWVWQGLQQHFEAQAMRDDHGVLCKVDFSGGHSNILKSAESRMWTALTTCDKNEGRQREAKRLDPNELVRFTARTPCCKQLFGEYLYIYVRVVKTGFIWQANIYIAIYTHIHV